MDEQTYEIGRWQRTVPRVMLSVFLVFGGVELVGRLRDADTGGVAFMALWLLAVAWMLVVFVAWVPQRVVLDDAGVTLGSRWRRVHIPWVDLVSVRPRPWDLGRQTLRWQRRGGRPVNTPWAFRGQHRMLSEIERRAPQAHVDS